jgi:signal transduction histidine kinase
MITLHTPLPDTAPAAPQAVSPTPWRRWLPDTLRNQVIALMFLGALFSQALVLTAWTWQARQQAQTEASQMAQELAGAAVNAVLSMAKLPVQYRPMLIDQLRATGGARFFMHLNRAPQPSHATTGPNLARHAARHTEEWLRTQLSKDRITDLQVDLASASVMTITDEGLRLADLPAHWVEASPLQLPGDPLLLRVQAQMEPGNWIVLVAALPNPLLLERTNPFATDRVLVVLASLLTVMLLVVLMARGLTRSLRRLDKAASAFAREMSAERIPEAGPREVRNLARSLNDMQAQIQRQMQDREHLFRSVSHDLQTPLMRLKLRTELIDDADMQKGLRADLNELGVMIKGALTTMRGSDLQEDTVPVRLDHLLQDLASAAMASGAPLTLQTCPLEVPGKPLAIKRALGNLIDNALRYGQSVEVDIFVEGELAVVRVRDHGPGLPEGALERIFEPYLRLEHGMNSNSMGSGLGLWISRNAIRRHGGDIVMRNRPEGGLEARVTLRRAVTHGAGRG